MSKSEIIKSLQDKISSNIRVALPGVIEAYDYKTQKANIRIDIKELYNNDTTIEYPILSNIPIIFPRSGGASITLPVKQGDSCLVMFLDRDITNWLLGASKQKPASKRIHHLSDAVAIMGLSPFTKASLSENNEDVLLSYSGSKIRLKPNGIIDIENAKEVNVKTESVIINCKNASVKAQESISAECKNASVKATEVTSIECKTASIKALESVSVDCKTALIKASESSNIECQNASVKASGSINTETPNFIQKGNMKIEGDIEITGTSELKGDTTCSATITGNVVKTSSGKDLATHTHSYARALVGSTPTALEPFPATTSQTQ